VHGGSRDGSCRGDEDAAPPATSPFGSGRLGWAAASVCALLALAIGAQHGLVFEALDRLRRAPLVTLGALGILVVAHKLLHASMLRTSVDGLSLRRAVLASEAYTGCTNAVIGGSGLGAGLKAAMLRSWGVSHDRIGASIVATSVAPGLAIWFLLVAESAPSAARGHGDATMLAAAAIGAVVLVGHALFWLVVLRHPVPAAALGRVAGAAARRLARSRLPQTRSCRARLAGLDAVAAFEGLRHRTLQLGRRQGGRLFVTALAAQIVLAVLLAVSLRTGGNGPTGLSTLEVLQAFALARAAAALLPVPGGLVVLDTGLLALLSEAGGDPSRTVAGIVVYRVLTFLCPMATGLAAALWWSRRVRRSPHARGAQRRELPTTAANAGRA